MPASFLKRHRTICAVLTEIKQIAMRDDIINLCDEALTYAKSMSDKLMEYKKSATEAVVISSQESVLERLKRAVSGRAGWNGWFGPESAKRKSVADAEIELAEEALRAELSRLSALVAWQDIETAPKTGEIVDLWCQSPSGGISGGPERVPNCWFYQGYWWTRDEQYGDEFNRRSIHGATHWLPLPAPPVAAQFALCGKHNLATTVRIGNYVPGSALDNNVQSALLALRSRPASALPVVGDGERKLVEQLWGALNFILAFYEPGQTYLDTEAWKQAEAGGKRARQAARDYLDRSALTPSVQP